MKHRLLVLCLITISALTSSLFIFPFAAGAFAGGDGTVESPRLISDCAELQEMDDQESYYYDYFELTNDIDCTEVAFAPLDFGDGNFRGQLDGAGFTISNLTINRTGSFAALFRMLEGATIKDLKIDNSSIQGNDNYVGLLAGLAVDSAFSDITITNTSVTGTSTEGSYAGGLVGNSTDSFYSDIFADVNINTPNYDSVGGFAGRSYGDWFDDIEVGGESTVEGYDYVGGLLGYTENPSVTDSLIGADVVGRGRVGGVVGQLTFQDSHEAGITSVIATGDVTGRSRVGGLVGNTVGDTSSDDTTYTISHSQAHGNVSGGGEVGGFVGDNNAATIEWSFATGNVNAILCECYAIGGFVGQNDYDEFSSGVILESYATGNVQAEATWDAGGFVGQHAAGTILDAYSRGNVSGYDGAGGFAGRIVEGTVGNSYSTGTVEGDSGVSGHTGNLEYGNINDSFFDEDTANVSDANVTGLTTTQAKTQSTYTDAEWDFENIWGMTSDVNNGYPCLRFEEDCGSEPSGGEEDVDSDGDGITDTVENAAPNGGDANGDGTADSQQDNVSSFVSGVTGQYVVVSLDAQCVVQSASVTAEASHAASDNSYSYPVGFLNFTANCGVASTNVNVRFFNLENANFAARKFNPNTKSYFTIDGASVTQGALGGLKFVNVAYVVVDNGPLDFNAASGVISDPVGLGVVGASGSLPSTGASTLKAVLTGFVLILGGVMLFAIRRRFRGNLI